MKMHNKVLTILIIFSMITSSSITTFADETELEGLIPDINTDGSQSSAVWFNVFDRLLEDKLTNGVKFFLILSSLRDNSLDSKIETALNENEQRKVLLSKYGLDKYSIYFFMNYVMSTFPENIDDIQYNYIYGENIYSDLYHDSDFNYSKYMVRFQNYLNGIFRQLPTEMQTTISKYDRKNAGEIVVMQGLMNIVISDYIAFETYNTVSGASVSRQLKLRSSLKEALVDELTRVANDYPPDYNGDRSIDLNEIDEYIEAFMGLGNVILNSIEQNLDEYNLMKYIVDLAGGANLLVRIPYTPTAQQKLIEITLRMNTEYIELDSSESLTDGYINSFQLVPTVGGQNAPVKYTIDDPTVANVSTSGMVTLSSKKQGIARITATVENYNVFKEIIVEVSEQSPQGAISFYGPYISGYPDGTFGINNYITRAEIATMLTRVLRLDLDENGLPISLIDKEFSSFNDVEIEEWFYKYIEIANQNGLISGYEDGTFRPNDPISRAEIAVVISNGWKALGISQSDLSTHFIRDVSVDHWAFSAINKLFNAGVVNGYNDGTYRPDAYVNRAEIVVMINNIINRKNSKPMKSTFSDVLSDHWAYGYVESATKPQVIQQEINDNN